MILATYLLFDRKDALIERTQVEVATLDVIERGEIVERAQHVGIVRRERLLADRQGPHVQRLHQIIAALVGIEQSKFLQRDRNIEMVRAQHLLANGQGTAVERLGLAMPLEASVHIGEIDQ